MVTDVAVLSVNRISSSYTEGGGMTCAQLIFLPHPQTVGEMLDSAISILLFSIYLYCFVHLQLTWQTLHLISYWDIPVRGHVLVNVTFVLVYLYFLYLHLQKHSYNGNTFIYFLHSSSGVVYGQIACAQLITTALQTPVSVVTKYHFKKKLCCAHWFVGLWS